MAAQRKGVTMRDEYTHISFVLDRSGSMEAVKDDTVGSMKAFIREQKATPGYATFTLTQFDTKFDIVYDMKPLNRVKQDIPFQPRGQTALLDAVGETIVKTGEKLSGMDEKDRPSQVIFVILTDGHENASKEYSREKIFEMIRHQEEKYNWKFVFLAAGQDAIDAGRELGVTLSTCCSIGSSGVATKKAFATMSRKMSDARISRDYASLSYTEQDRKEQEKLGAHAST